MTDLFGSPIRKRPVGYGNAMFLADLTEGVSDPDMRAKFKAGDYPDIHFLASNIFCELAFQNQFLS